jgi:hypothetical protein
MPSPKPGRIKASDLADHPREQEARQLAAYAIRESRRQQAESFRAFATGLRPQASKTKPK